MLVHISLVLYHPVPIFYGTLVWFSGTFGVGEWDSENARGRGDGDRS